MGSTFGTYLNDKRLSEPKRASEPYKLKAYDSIKVGQTSLRWRPIDDIRRALAVCVPQPCGHPREFVERLPPMVFAPDERNALMETLVALYVQACRTPTPPPTPSVVSEGPVAVDRFGSKFSGLSSCGFKDNVTC